MKEKLLEYRADVHLFCKKNKGFSTFLALQFLVLLYLVVRLFTPLINVDVSLAELAAQSVTGAAYLHEETLVLENTAGDTSEFYLMSMPFALAPGAYTITATYESTYDVANPSHSMYDESVILTVQASGTQSYFVETDRMLLKDSAQKQQERIWVKYGQPATALQLSLMYNGQGHTEISSIQIEEQWAWRLLTLLGTVLAFGIVSAAAYLLCTVAVPCKVLRGDIKQPLITFFCLFAITMLASLPLFASYLYNGADLSFHLTRIASVAAELGNGQFPVRMMTEMLNGYGYVNPLFYCDIFLYLPAVLHNCMLPLYRSYQVYAILINGATCAIAYYSFKKISHSRGIALAGAAMYTLAHYRLANIYTRAGVGEYTALVFFPLIVLGLWNVYKVEKPRYQDCLPLALGMLGVVQSHILSAEIVVIFLAVFCVFTLKYTLIWWRIKSLLCAVVLFMLLGAWFLVPFLQSLTQMDMQFTLAASGGEIQRYGLTVFEFFNFGGVIYTIGWSVFAGALLVCCIMVIENRFQLRKLWKYQAMQVCMLLAALAALFSLEFFPWAALAYGIHPALASIVNIVQYPARYLAVCNIAIVSAVVVGLMLLKQYVTKYYKTAILCLGAISAMFAGQFYTDFVYNAAKIAPTSITAGSEMTMTVVAGEYVLQGSDLTKLASTKVLASSDATIVSYQKLDGVAYVTYTNNSESEQTLLLPIFNYPNYRATNTQTGDILPITNGENNRISLAVAAGTSGTIKVAYVAPWYWHVAEAISVLSWAFVAFMAVTTRCKKRTTETVQLEEECRETADAM